MHSLRNLGPATRPTMPHRWGRIWHAHTAVAMPPAGSKARGFAPGPHQGALPLGSPPRAAALGGVQGRALTLRLAVSRARVCRMLIERADFTDLDALAAHRQRCWERQRDYVLANSPLHHRAWGGMAPPPRLEGLAELPLIDKEMLRASQRASPPFGDYLAAPADAVARVHRTSGTTGTAMNLAMSAADAQQTAVVGGRAQSAAGLGPGHRVVHCLKYRLWMGGFTDHATLEATGATVVPFGVGETQLLVRTIQELGITAISCTPSYPAVLEQVLAEHFPGVQPRDLGLRLGLFGGEAGLDDPSFRRRLETTWGMAARNANYGMSDVFSNFASQTEHDNDLHFVALDVLHPELIAPESGAVLPWREGERGELVLTHLSRECQPLVRFRTGDIILLTGTDRARRRHGGGARHQRVSGPGGRGGQPP